MYCKGTACSKTGITLITFEGLFLCVGPHVDLQTILAGKCIGAYEALEFASIFMELGVSIEIAFDFELLIAFLASE